MNTKYLLIAIAIIAIIVVVAWKMGLLDKFLKSEKDATVTVSAGVTAPAPTDAAVTAPAPTDAAVTAPAPADSAVTAPANALSRFCDRSGTSAEDYSESVEDTMHHSGYSHFTANAMTSRYKTSMS